MQLSKRFLVAFIDIIRPQFGFQNVCCIYPVSCSDYAKTLIMTSPWYYYGPRIALRLLSCNPITVLLRFIIKKLLSP